MAILTDENYVDLAENSIRSLRRVNPKTGEGEFKLTTSQIRKILSLTSAIFDEARLRPYEEVKHKLAYLRVQIVYQSGREPIKVKKFVETAQILEALKEVNDKKSLLRFCRYMEALVAYFKFLGGKEN